MRFLVLLEEGEPNVSAYVPDLPGCVSTGNTVEHANENIREAIAGHLEVIREDGDPIPEPRTSGTEVDVQVV